MLATIFLSAGTERVTVRDMPRLFADAIHPPVPNDSPRALSYVLKEALNVELANEWCGTGSNFPVPLTDEDWLSLNDGVWSNLPPIFRGHESDEGPRRLDPPLPEPQWEAYREAFEAGPAVGWRLEPVWRNTVFEQWFFNHEAQKDWERLLRRRVMLGELVTCSPTSLIPTPGMLGRQLQESFLTVDEFTKFAAPFSIDVRVMRRFTRPPLVAQLLQTLRVEPPDERIELHEDIAGISSHAIAAISVFVAPLEEAAHRQAEGYLTVGEAAQLLSDANPGVVVKDLVERMRRATVGSPARRLVRGPSRLPALDDEILRSNVDLLVEVRDVDEWLTDSMAVAFRLAPLMNVELVPAPGAAPKAVMSNAISTVGAPRAAWLLGLEALLPELERSLGRTAKVREVIKHLKSNGAANYRIEPDGGPDQLFWRTDMGDRKLVEKKTISNAVSDWRKNRNPA